MDGAVGLDSSRNTSTSFIRVVSLSIALYDYVLTLPAEWRFYRSQRSWRLSLGCLLFIAIRYSSIAVITLSNVGYFGNFFTPESCAHYFIAAPIFKVIQTMISQLILGIRTVNISRRSTHVTWIIAVSFVCCTAAQWFLNLWNRVPVQGRHNNCTAGNRPPVLTVWLYYLLSIVYDILTLGISSMYLIGFNPNSGKMAHLRRIMLTDGLVYFVALTGVNIFNLILYRRPDEAIQSSGVSLGYALTWIMSQRILIHLRDAAAAHNRTVTTQLVVSRPLPSAHSVARAMRSQFDSDSKERVRHHAGAGGVLSSGFDLETDGGPWSRATGERSVFTVSVGQRSCGCSCDCGWASQGSVGESGERRGRGSRRRGSSRGRSASGTGSATSGMGPVASATLGSSSRRTRGDEEAGHRSRTPSRNRSRRHEGYGDDEDEKEDEPDVRVQVEETVLVEVEYDPEAYVCESYRTPRVLWEVRGGGDGGASQTHSWRSGGGRSASRRNADPT